RHREFYAFSLCLCASVVKDFVHLKCRLFVETEHILQCIAHFAQCAAFAYAFNQQRHCIGTAGRAFTQRVESALHCAFVAATAQRVQPLFLVASNRFVNVENRNLLLLFHLEFVYSDNDLFFAFNCLLILIRRFRNLFLGEATLDCLNHSAHFVDLAEVVKSAFFHFVGQFLYEI